MCTPRRLHSSVTGRMVATPALLERITVEYYGAQTPLQQLAQVHAPEARLLVIQPYDRGAITAIEKAIQKSELGLNPGNDGQLIRIPVPALTEERRKEFVKLVKRHAEEARVAIRNIRRDEIDRGLAQIQKITDRFIARVEEIAHRKEADILEV